MVTGPLSTTKLITQVNNSLINRPYKTDLVPNTTHEFTSYVAQYCARMDNIEHSSQAHDLLGTTDITIINVLDMSEKLNY